MIQFGIKTGPGGYSFDDLKRLWLEAEKLGFDSAWLYDHFYSLKNKDETCLECWTSLSALAALTQRLKVGSLVLCNQFRHPSLLAKMAATLDVLSKGRLQLGIGAGWYGEESQQFGIEFPDARTRIQRLEESVKILKIMWESEKATFNGKYYSIKEAVCNPKPAQKPHPPIWVGIIRGTRLMPKIAAEVADGVNLTFIPPMECARRVDLVKAAMQKLKRPSDAIQFSWQGRILIASDEKELETKKQALANKNRIDVASLVRDLTAEAAIIGKPDECVKVLQAYVKSGIEHFMLIFLGDESSALRLFAEQVMPHFARD